MLLTGCPKACLPRSPSLLCGSLGPGNSGGASRPQITVSEAADRIGGALDTAEARQVQVWIVDALAQAGQLAGQLAGRGLSAPTRPSCPP